MWLKFWLSLRSVLPITAIIVIVLTFCGLALLPVVAPYSEPPKPPTRQLLSRTTIYADGMMLEYTNVPISVLFSLWQKGQGWQVTVTTNSSTSNHWNWRMPIRRQQDD